MATMYTRKSRLTARQQGRLIEHFVAGSTARTAAEIVGVQPNTAIRFFMRLRQLIASKLPSYRLSGEVEVDESYFGGIRKCRRGRGAAGKVAVFGLLKQGGKVYTAIIPNAKTENLPQIIQEKADPDSIVYTDAFGVYNALDVSACRCIPSRMRAGNKPWRRDRAGSPPLGQPPRPAENVGQGLARNHYGASQDVDTHYSIY